MMLLPPHASSHARAEVKLKNLEMLDNVLRSVISPAIVFFPVVFLTPSV